MALLADVYGSDDAVIIDIFVPFLYIIFLLFVFMNTFSRNCWNWWMRKMQDQKMTD